MKRAARYGVTFPGLMGADDADDILQDVLVLISRKLYWLEQPELFRAWAFRIQPGRVPAPQEAAAWVDAAVDESWLDQIAAPDTAAPDDTLRCCWTALCSARRGRPRPALSRRDAACDVAAVLEIPLGTVKSRLAFGLKRLRARLDHGGQEELKDGTRT